MSENIKIAIKSDDTVYGRDEVIQIINSVVSKVQGNVPSSPAALSQELIALKKIIEEARSQLNDVQPDDIRGVHIPTASDELDAVVGATEEATGLIMDSCERIQMAIEPLQPDVTEAIDAEVIKIFEACSFQDITGQRIAKVVKALQIIDHKISCILGEEAATVSDVVSAAAPDITKPDTLLNGPQMKDQAITQDDIDALLASFDE